MTIERSITAHELTKMLKTRYAPPEWITEPEVTFGTRRVDLIAFRTYASAPIGRRLLAFEVKVFRSDWLKELGDHTKAEAAFASCDQFWVVTAKGIVTPGEVPSQWGWLEQQGTRLVTRQYPDGVKKPEPPPEHMPREIAARLLYRAAEREQRREWHAEREANAAVRNEIEAKVAKRYELEMKQLERIRDDYEALLKQLRIGPTYYRAQEQALEIAGVLNSIQRQGGPEAALRQAATRLREQSHAVEEALRKVESQRLEGAA